MKKYSKFERLIGQKLDSFPQIRHHLKNVYQHANYYIYREKGFSIEMNSKIDIQTPDKWLGVKNNINENELFFGYYDKTPWSESMEKILYHELDRNNQLRIIMYDKRNKTKHFIGVSEAWNYQQGSMLQWLPKNENRFFIYNDIENKNLISIIYDTQTMAIYKKINYPIQSINPKGCDALTLNYKRLFKLRAQYGYSAKIDNYNEKQSMDNDGIWKIDLINGTQQLILTLEELIHIDARVEMINAAHKINHIIYSPNGEKFVFMHRWLSPKGKFSRLYVSDGYGSNLKILMDTRMVSHYSWYDDCHVVAWARTETKGDQYYLINVENGYWETIGEGVLNLFGDGHPSFSPDKKWMITDTYPDKSRQRHLLLYDMENKKMVHLGRFFAPIKFNWDKRVDLHPRWSPDGKMVSIDSCHEGVRYSYIINLAPIIGGTPV